VRVMHHGEPAVLCLDRIASSAACTSIALGDGA
jgi:hypothetical protein